MDVETYAFGTFQLIPGQRLLLGDGGPLRLGSRALDILTVLIESAGETISNSQIIARVWQTTFVEEASLRVHIGALRKALGDGRAGNRFIANIPGRGYAFVAPVRREQGGEPVAPPATEPAAGNLPTPLASIVGRDDTIARLAGQVARRRFLTIVGTGGIGKTTVAIVAAGTVANSYPDGVWFVALASLPASDLVSSAIGAALGVAPTGRDPLPGLIAWLRDKHALIVLDNCEHVVDAAAVVAEAILKAAPQVAILATSREPLRAEGEALFRLAPLGVPPSQAGITAREALRHSAVQLFHERARASGGEFMPTDADAPALCEICRKLDGLPLALELAAAQVDTFGVQGLAQGLNDRFALLIKGRRTAAGRQQTLHATLDWSHDLLPQIERTVLRRLAVFRGDFTMDAAAAVVSDEQISGFEVIASVATLAGKSLVATDISSDGAYYRLLETTRVYAHEKLVGSADATLLRRRHAEYYLNLFQPAESEREFRPQAEWLADYGRHIDNVRTSLDWAFSPDGDPQTGVALTIAVVPLWTELSLLGECRERVEQALASLDSRTATAARPRMQLSAALGWSLMYGVGRARESSDAWAATLKLAEELGDTPYRLRALWGLCIDQFNSGKASTALEFARRFAGLVEGSTDAIKLMMADRILATAFHYLGDQKNARLHIDRALAYDATLAWQNQTVRSRFDLRVSAHYFQARILWLQGYADQALHVVEHNIEEGRDIGQVLSFCSVLGQGACPIAFLSGDFEAAEQYCAMLIEHTERHPVRLWNIWARCFNGLVMARRGDIAGGLRVLRDGLEQAGDARFLPRFLFVQGEQAQLLGKLGEVGLALEGVDQMLARCEARDEGWYVAELLRIKGELMLERSGQGALADAEALFLRSLDEARRQGALSWELRTAMNLARLWSERRRRADAGALLRSVYASFTEGFATDDLRAAKELLEELP